MSASVAAFLKQIAASLLTNRKVLKFIGGVILVVVIIVCIPIYTVVGIFSGDITIDINRFQELLEQNMSAEDEAMLRQVESIMLEIEDTMTAEGFSSQRITEAQVLYVLALSDYASQPGFVDKLVGCFTPEQTDANLISSVNAAFGTNLLTLDFTTIMESIRAVYIDISTYADPATKNNLDLVQWAIRAEDRGWGYVWGTYGQVFDQTLYEYKLSQYPEEVGRYAAFIEANWLGGRTADCIGLIKGYGWLNPETQEIEYGTNGMADVGADQMYWSAVEKGAIDSIPEIPGLAVWHSGHIGIYIGGGEVIEAKGTQYGVVRTNLEDGSWTHWLKIPYITYLEEEPETEPTTYQDEDEHPGIVPAM